MERLLRGLRGPHADGVYVLTRSVTFGRAAATDIQILDQRVSRQHARLMVQETSVVLIDLSSANGTYVRGHRIHRRALQSGDRIQIGEAEYVYEEASGTFETSPRFRGKLTTKATLGATIVRKVANEILAAPTAEMPEAELEKTLPSLAPPRSRDTPTREAPTAVASAGHASVSRTPTREATPALSRRSGPKPRTNPSIPFAPRDPSLLSAPEAAGFETEPLDPRRHGASPTPVPRRRTHDDLPATPTPVPRRRTVDDLPAMESEPGPAKPAAMHASGPHDPRSPTPAPRRDGVQSDAPESAQQAVDAVLRLLVLRHKEARGARLRVQEREGIRRLEAALRSPRASGNRRRWARLPCKLTARLGDGATTSALVTDIGAGGISIEGSDLPIAPGDEVTIRVMLGLDRVSRTAVFHTRVVWVDALEGTFGAVFAGPASWEMTA